MSIGKKFVTAVATAGLLAGLFGSAFVPSAMARGADEPKVSTDADEWFNYSHPFLTDDSDNGNYNDGYIQTYKDNTWSVTNKMMYIHSYAVGAQNGNHAYGPKGFADAEDMSIGFELVNDDGNDIELADLTATVGGAKSVEVAWAYDGNGADQRLACRNRDLNDVFGLVDTVTDIVSDNTDNDKLRTAAGEYFLCIQPVSVNKLGASTITVVANGITVAVLDITVLGNVKNIALSIEPGLNAVEGTVGAYNRIAAGNADIDDYFKVEVTDALGQRLNMPLDNGYYIGTLESTFSNDSIDEIGTFDDAQVENADGDPIEFVGSEDRNNTLDLAADTCTDADAGETYTIGVEGMDYDDSVVESNTVTIICTGASDEAVLSNIVTEYATGEADWADSAAGEADADGVISVTATVKDADGNLLGLDDTLGFDIEVDDNGWDGTLLAAGDIGDLNLSELASPVMVGGKTRLAVLNPQMIALAKYEYVVTVVDADLGEDEDQEIETKLYYTAASGIDLEYSLSRKRNAAKTSATWTADYGVMCSNALIEFNWENNDGSKTGTVNRRANADGVATFTMARRNTKIWVYTTGCAMFEGVTDLVAARFK